MAGEAELISVGANTGQRMHSGQNTDEAELAKFEELAHRWWDREGAFKTLHDINPLRCDYIDERVALQGKRVLDVGCGGGILSEEMAQRGATVIGLDASETVIEVARLHQMESGIGVEYLELTAEELAEREGQSYDVVTCLELLEHVPDPQSLVQACTRLARPEGHVFFSTINRRAKAWLYAIVGAEYLLGLLPKGTHEYQKFIRPSELAAWARGAGLELLELTGMRYNPLSGEARLCQSLDINYLAWMKRRQ